MRPGRPAPALILTRGEREALRAWTRQPECPQPLALRASVILLCADGLSNSETAAELHITGQTVSKWQRRFIEKRLDGLLDESRSGTPREPSASHAAHWSTRSPTEAGELSRANVHRVWRAFSLQPRRTESFRLLKDSIPIDKRRM